jgi:hypothetical protein
MIVRRNIKVSEEDNVVQCLYHTHTHSVICDAEEFNEWTFLYLKIRFQSGYTLTSRNNVQQGKKKRKKTRFSPIIHF